LSQAKISSEQAKYTLEKGNFLAKSTLHIIDPVNSEVNQASGPEEFE